MDIAFDLHGVFDTHQHLVDLATSLVKDKDSTVFIISGPPMHKILQELEELGLQRGKHYDIVLSVVDHIRRVYPDYTYQDGRGYWRAPNLIWNRAKAEICYNEDISLLFDDSPEYGEYFEAGKFVLVQNK